MKRRQEIGAIAFARGFQQRAYSQEDLWFPNFRYCCDANEKVSLRDFPAKEKVLWETFAGVDLSSDRRPGTVIYLLSVRPDRKFVPRVIRAGKWTAPETIAQMEEVDQVHRPRIWRVENNAYQQSLIDISQSLGEGGLKLPDGRVVNVSFASRLLAFTTGAQKADPMRGLPAMDVEFANVGWAIPMRDREGHPEACSCGFCRWLREMERYPHLTDDTVMACYFAWDTALTYSKYLQAPVVQERRELSREEPEPEGILERMFR